jgi:hypothetical protein
LLGLKDRRGEGKEATLQENRVIGRMRKNMKEKIRKQSFSSRVLWKQDSTKCH